MEGYEVFNLIKNDCKSVEDAIIETNNIVETLTNDKKRVKWISDFNSEKEKLALENYKCPECGNELEEVTYSESRGEYQGTECAETLSYLKCTYCSFTTE